MAVQIEPQVVADAGAWAAWLAEYGTSSDGIWLLLAKKGTVHPTSLTYPQALDEALCHGWIDGQKRSFDEATFLQRFTPRRPRSMWSQRNVEHVERLTREGRMLPTGLAEVERAKADGRWERAYPGQASAQIPPDLAQALAAIPGARERFDALPSQERFRHLHQVMTAANEATRARRLQRVIDAVAAGE